MRVLLVTFLVLAAACVAVFLVLSMGDLGGGDRPQAAPANEAGSGTGAAPDPIGRPGGPPDQPDSTSDPAGPPPAGAVGPGANPAGQAGPEEGGGAVGQSVPAEEEPGVGAAGPGNPATAATGEGGAEDERVAELRRMLTGDDPRAQILALRELHRLPPEEGIPIARAILVEEQNVPLLRMSALRALYDLGEPGAAEALAGALSSQAPWLALQTAQVLGELAEPGTLPAVEAAYQASPEGPMRFELAVTLGKLGKTGPATVYAQQAISALQSPDPAERSLGVRTLGRLRDPAHNPSLIQALGDPDQEVRHEAALVLAYQGTPDALPALHALLDDPLPRTVNAAKEAIRYIEHPEQRPTRKRFLLD